MCIYKLNGKNLYYAFKKLYLTDRNIYINKFKNK